MAQLQNGQLIEACLFMLDQNPHPHPAFNAPAISINEAAHHLLVAESAMSSRQICQAIAPLAETLFPSPPIPTPKVLKGERWIVFETHTGTDQVQEPLFKRQHKRNTLIGRPPPNPLAVNFPLLPVKPLTGGVRPLRLAHNRSPSHTNQTKESVPLLAPNTLIADMSERIIDLPPVLPVGVVEEPKSAGRGKRSFLKPFLLKGKRKPLLPDEKRAYAPPSILPDQGQEDRLSHSTGSAASSGHHPAANKRIAEVKPQNSETETTHVLPPTADKKTIKPLSFRHKAVFRSDTVSNILDDYLDEVAVESPYEETAFISGSVPQAQPLHPIALPISTEQPSDAYRLETKAPPNELLAVVPKSNEIVDLPISSDAPLVVAMEITPGNDSPVQSRTLEPEKNLELADETKVEAYQSHLIDHNVLGEQIDHVPETEFVRSTTPTSSPPQTPMTPIPRSEGISSTSKHTDHHSSKHRVHRSERNIERKERKKPKEGRRDETEEERQARKSRTREREGPKRHRTSKEAVKKEQQWLEVVFDGLPFGPNGATLRVFESIQTDWRIFLAELVALVGLAYVVQASGW